MYKIYGLKEEGTDLIKYIGVTKLTPSRRLFFHYYDKRKSIKRCWISSVEARNGKVVIEVLEDNLTEQEAFRKECEYIRLFKSFGANLKNMTIGGENPPNSLGKFRSQETKDRISKANKISKLGKMIGVENHKSKQIIQLCKDTEKVLGIFGSKRQATASTGVCKNTINRHLKRPDVCLGGGFNWKEISKTELQLWQI